jgi:predicted nucleic acid-binding protein
MAHRLIGKNCMNALEFADTNIVVYAVGHPSERQAKARAILAEGLTVSSQVINETVSVLSRKQGVSLAIAHEVAESLLELCQVAPVNGQTIRKAIGLTRRHQLSHWDSLIVAAALLAGCEILYSQDMQHGQVFDGQLKVVNPFV